MRLECRLVGLADRRRAGDCSPNASRQGNSRFPVPGRQFRKTKSGTDFEKMARSAVVATTSISVFPFYLPFR